MRKLWAFKTFTNALTSTYTPFLFSGINSWEKALKSPKIQAYFRCNSYERRLRVPKSWYQWFWWHSQKIWVIRSIFIQNSMGEKRGETWYFIHRKKMLLIPLCFPKQTIRHHFFCSIQVHKSFLGRIFQISLWRAVKCTTGFFCFFCPNVNIVNWGGASKILIDLWEIWAQKGFEFPVIPIS